MQSHRGAAMARKALVAVAAAAWGSGARPAVDWSLPQSPQLLKQYREVTGHSTTCRIASVMYGPDGLVTSSHLSYARRCGQS